MTTTTHNPTTTSTDATTTVRGGFLQLIEFTTSQPERVKAAVDDFQATMGDASAVLRCAMVADRDQPGTHLLLVEFADHDAAMRNSSDPRTGDWARTLAELATDIVYRNLDVTDTIDSTTSATVAS